MSTHHAKRFSTMLGFVVCILFAAVWQEHTPQQINPSGLASLHCAVDNSFSPPKCVKRFFCTCPPGSAP
jgi:hypothetical protein